MFAFYVNLLSPHLYQNIAYLLSPALALVAANGGSVELCRVRVRVTCELARQPPSERPDLVMVNILPKLTHKFPQEIEFVLPPRQSFRYYKDSSGGVLVNDESSEANMDDGGGNLYTMTLVIGSWVTLWS